MDKRWKALLEQYKPLKTNEKRRDDIDDIMEMYACRYPEGQKEIDNFRGLLYYELSQVSDSEIPHTPEDKMNYCKTRWAYFLINKEENGSLQDREEDTN